MTEEKIWKKVKQREKIMSRSTLLSNLQMSEYQNELQKEHQKALYWETKASGEEKIRFTNLRNEIEIQQMLLVKPKQEAYKAIANRLAPKQTVVKNTIMAFIFGGIICTIGQIINNLFLQGGLAVKEAATSTSVIMISISAFLTGLGYYDELGKIAGAGTIVPITGFANSIVSSAMEFKREGYIYGVGARIFTVAGPVIVYGTLVSIVIGLVYYFIK